MDALVSRDDRIFNLCRRDRHRCPVVIEGHCLEDESEVILGPDSVSRLEFVFRPDNRTLSKTISAREAKNCRSPKEPKIKMAQSGWPAFAGILLAAVISLVGSF